MRVLFLVYYVNEPVQKNYFGQGLVLCFLLGLSYNMHMQRNGGNTGWGDPSTKHNPTTPRQTPRTETKGPEGAVRSAGRVLTYPRAEALMGRCQHGGLRLSGPPLSLFRADCGTPRGLSEP